MTNRTSSKKNTFGPDQNEAFSPLEEWKWKLSVPSAQYPCINHDPSSLFSLLIAIPMDKMPSFNLSAPLAMDWLAFILLVFDCGSCIFCLSPWAECDIHLEIVSQESEQYSLLWLLAIWKFEVVMKVNLSLSRARARAQMHSLTFLQWTFIERRSITHLRKKRLVWYLPELCDQAM